MSGRRSYTPDLTWEHPREAFAGLLPAAWGRDTPSPVPRLSEAQMPPEDGEVWYEPALAPSRTSPGPAQTSFVPSRASPGLAQPTQSQSSQLSHQKQHQHPTLIHQLSRGLMDYFSRAGDGGEPQQLGRTRAQTARNQARIDRPQTVNDVVAQLGRTRGQTARNKGGMRHGLLS